MPFLSQHLLLDLPFYKTMPGDATRWPDTSATGLSAYIQDNCTADTLDRLGTCLKIDAGGYLTLANADPPSTGLPIDSTRLGLASLKQRMAGTQQITIEFWAKPIPERAATNDEKILLSGPVKVWTQGKALYWQWAQGENLVTYQLGDIEGLHHWAIVANAEATPPEVFILRDGLATKVDPFQSTPNPSAQMPTDTPPLMIGASQSGWTGKLAHLRIWATALSAEQIQQHMQRDITAHAAFKATTGLEWRLLNGDNEPSLYIYNSRQAQELHVELENTTQETTLVIAPGTQPPSATNYHFQLVFRPGTLAAFVLEHFATPRALGDWSVSYHRINDEDCFSFLLTGDEKSLAPGKKLTLVLPSLAAEPGAGSRTTQVMLRYKAIQLKAGGTILPRTLDGHRAQVLNIFYRSPFLDGVPKPPLEVGVVGAPVVLNNGQPTCLTFYIKNINRDEDGNVAPLILGDGNAVGKTPKFILEIDFAEKAISYVEVAARDLQVDQVFYYQNSQYKLKTEVPKADIVVKDSNGKIQYINRPQSPVTTLEILRSFQEEDIKNGDRVRHAGKWRKVVVTGRVPDGNIIQVEASSPGRHLPTTIKASVIVKNSSSLLKRKGETDAERLTKGDIFWHNETYYEFESRSFHVQVEDDKGARKTLELNLDQVLVAREEDLILSGLGDTNDLNKTEISFLQTPAPASGKKLDSIASFSSWEIIPNRRLKDGKIGFLIDEVILFKLSNIVVTTPPGRSFLRLRYEDIDKYGEGIFEIPIDRVPAIPAKVNQNGQGYGLALGHDPRINLDNPNAPALDQMLSVKQVGKGGAVRIDNSGSGVGLTVNQQNDPGLAAKFIGGSGVEIDNKLVVNVGGAEITGKLEAKGGAEITNKLVVKTGGAEITGKFNAKDDAEIKGDLKVGKRIHDQSGLVMPVGAIVPFAGSVAPEGWLFCNGASYSKTTYSNLFNVIGETYGVEGRDQFKVPNLAGNFPIGASNNNKYQLGSTGGSETITLTIQHMPEHSHGHSLNIESGGGHNHCIGAYTNAWGKGLSLLFTTDRANHKGDVNTSSDGDHAHRLQGSINTEGGGSPYEYRPPFIALNYIIKY